MSMSVEFARSLFQGMETQLKRQSFPDVIVYIDGEEFQCHRYLLSACSDYFRAMFRSGMRETETRKVDIKGMAPETFRLILDLIYTARDILTPDNVINVWQASCRLQIGCLQMACELFLREHSTKENCMGVYMCAKQLSCDAVSELAWNIIFNEFQYLFRTEELFMLDGADMKRLVASDDLKVVSEDMVVRAIVKWAKFETNHMEDTSKENANGNFQASASESTDGPEKDLKKIKGHDLTDNPPVDKQIRLPQENSESKQGRKNKPSQSKRESYLSSLLSACRLCLVSGVCLQELVEDPMIVQNKNVFSVVKKALRYQLLPDRKYNFCPQNAVHRKNSSKTNVIFTVICDKEAEVAHYYLVCKSDQSNEWRQAVKCDVDPAEDDGEDKSKKCAAILYGDSIFETTVDGTMKVFRYHLMKMTRTHLVQPIIKRTEQALVCHGSFMYVIAGDPEGTIERLNLEDAIENPGDVQWERVAQLVEPITRAAAAVFNNKIVVIGRGAREERKDPNIVVQSFDPETLTTQVFQVTLPGVDETMVFLNIWSEVYILQGSGKLWQLQDKPDTSTIEIIFRGRLWSKPLIIKSAVIFKDELSVLARDPPAPEAAAVAADAGAGTGDANVAGAGNANAEGGANAAVGAPNSGGDGAEVQMVDRSEWDSSRTGLFKHVRIMKDNGHCLVTGVIATSQLEKMPLKN